MARFIEDRSSLKKKKKKENATQKAAPSSANKKQAQNVANQVVNRTANAAKRTTNTVGNSAQRQNTVRRNVQKAVAENAPQRYNNRPSGAAQPSTNHTVQDRLAASRQRREQAEADIKRRRQETEARSQRISQSRNPRMQDTARGVKQPTLEERRQKQDRLRQAQQQKMGNNSMASKEAQRTANRALKNTPTVAKESAKQVGIGHGKTFADLTEKSKSASIGSKIDIKSKEFQEDIEKRRKESTRVAKSSFKTLSDMQEKSEQKLQQTTKNAKGLEKAYYGALESGVGMATDRLAGPAWAVSMLSRTYGNTRGQAQKEGATEEEDMAYSLSQALKEVATEYFFQGTGLAKGLSGRYSLSLGEKAANALTKNMRGPLANATHAGIRLLGGTAEENAEEAIGWGLDPFIKEFTYGRNVRTRQAQQMMRDQSNSLRSNITNEDDARAAAAYLSSDDFLDSQVRTYMDSGIGEKEARELAEDMRDYLDASLSGDTDRMADIEESLSKKLSGRSVTDIAKQDLSLSELKDTIASTTLLTATTGLPGAFSTAARGAAVKEQLGTDGIRALAKTAEDFEDREMQLKAKAMSDRLDAGKDITSTQAYDLAVGVQEQYAKDADRQQTAYQTAQKTIKSEKLVTPYRVSRDGDIQMDEVTDKTYQSTAKSAKSAIETFIENSDGKESLTDTEIDRGSRAIAGFKTGVFTVDDANELNFRNTAVRSAFEKETGVDLGEYVVKGKDGQIDIPATNTATKNALFAKAADNLVATAQAETANWVDNTKGEVVTQISRRMGASGTAALQTALDDVDERDRSSYMMTANASDVLYQSARNMGTEWENAKDYAKRMFPNVAEDKLKAMYEAGLADRDMATDEARGQQIKIGEKVELKKNNEAPTGQVIVETSAPVKGSVIRTFTELARNLGVDIHLVDHFTDSNGKVLKNVNGEYIDGNIFINVNSDFEKNMGFIFMHEVTHHLKMYAPEQYKALENLVREKWFKYDSAQMQSEIAKKIETYAKHGQKLTEEQALEEIIADAAHEFLTDANFAREVANEDASLAQAVLTSIRNALRMLRRIMSADNLDETHMNTLFSQLDILDEAERLWLDAYKQAVRNNAAVEVDRLQNQIYEEGRMSVPDYSQEDMDAHRQALIDEMSEYYSSPYTDNYAEAGFVFPDGQMLRMGMDGQRGEDHRIASHAYDDISDREDALNSFINEGNIRWMPELSTMEFGASSEPTAEQYEWIRDVARNYSTMSGMLQGIREIDFTDKNGETVESKIVTNESADVIVNTIKRFYKTGTAEGGSQLSQFRYSISDTDSEGNAITEAEATVLHDIGPDVRFSMTTENEPQAKAAFRAGKGEYRGYKYEMSGRELRTKLIKENFPEGQADAIVKAIDSFMDATGGFLTDKDGLRMKYQFIGWDDLESGTVSVRRDKNGKIRSVNFSAMKKNDEYPVNFDFSTVCNKRISFTKVIEEIAKAHDAETGASVFSEIKLTPDNMWKINEALKAEGIDTACLGCFVESRRYHIDTFFQNVEDRWNKPVREARRKLGLPEEDYFNFSKEEVPGEQWSAADDNWGDYGRAKAFKGAPLARTQVLMNEIVKAGDVDSPLLKLIRPSDLLTPEGFEGFRKLSNAKIDMVGQIKSMYGAGVPKEILGFTPYNSEIALLPKNYKKTKMEKYLKSIGGIRIQSFSDFMIEHVYDHFQLIADAAYRKLPIHAYTKVIAYAKIFGLTGAKINMSVMFDVKNSKQWAEDLGISEADAKQYADKYQGLRFVTETPAEYKTAYKNANTDEKLKKKYDKYISEGATEEEARRKTADWAVRPYRPITLEGRKGYLTYLVSDADYVNEQYQRMYNQYISEGMSEAEAERKANSNKPFEQSINYREAKALQDQDGYRENVGIIGVAFGDEHLRMMMDDENVRYIIPYHSSNLPVVVSNKTNLKVARDYSDRQNTYKAESWTINGETYNDLKSAYAEFKRSHKDEAHPARAFFADAFSKNLDAKFGDKVEGSNTGAFDVYKSLDTAKEISDVSERYLEDCIENNYIPVFHEFADSPGYYKMLFDFMVADDNGSLYPQHEVRNNYPGVDVDAKAEAGETVTDNDLAELKKVIEEGAKAQNDKLQKWQDRKGNVMQDLLSREGEHSIIADSNINSVRYGTEDYTNPKTGEGIPKAARMSISEDLDEPYMAAVNAGNTDEVQRLVDEAAKVSGLNSPLLYHGTYEQFTTFKGNEFLSEINGLPQIKGYFSEDRDVSEVYGDVSRYYVGINNPLDFYDVPWSQTETEWRKWFESKGVTDIKFDSSIYEDTLKEHINDRGENEYSVFEIFDGADMWAGDGNLTERIAAAGYDGMRWDYDEKAWMPFDDKRIKSADPVTYAEDGSVIPLSERFDPTNNDIRYSMSTEDADGNVLTTNQMEYFKNSQARDENGRLVPVYHATSVGGFTIFDPSYSDDKRSLFFSSNKDVANTYVGKYLYTDEDRLGDTSLQLTNWDDLVDYAKDAYFSVGIDWDYDEDQENLGWFIYEKGNEDTPVFELGEADTYDEMYRVWLDMVKRGDPKADNYKVRVTIPYEEGGDTMYKMYEGYGVEDLLNNIMSDPAPQAGYYQVYLNLENPLIIEGDGQSWDSIAMGGSVVKANKSFYINTKDSLLRQASDKDDMFGIGQAWSNGDKLREEAEEAGDRIQIDLYGADKVYVDANSDAVAATINNYFGLDEDAYLGYEVANDVLGHVERDGGWRKYYGTDYLRSFTGEETHDTREWAEIAQAEGYDGVIFRNIIDLDNKTELDEDEGVSDIFIAFSSNQVKDTRNENPTENPDIRYSITEDEIKSGVDYDHATDMSYEALLMYEDMIANASESSDIESAFGKAFDGEKVSKFYSALTEEVGMVFDDEYLEDGRMRMAKSKADFWSNLNTKWQERWETKGEVLDTKSVKTNVRNLIRGVMNNSDTDRQYKTELLNKTLMDMRVAYQLMKQDRTDIASALLYHSALRMITDVDFIQDDTEYQEYKGIRDYLRGEPITVGEDYWQSKAFQQFRKEHYGILKLRKGANGNIGEVYAQLENLYPHIFSEAERSKYGFKDDEEDLLQYIGFVTEQNMQPFMEAYSSEYCADWAFEIADDLYEIMENGEGVTSLADRYKEKYDAKAKAMKTRHAEAILRVRKQKDAAIDALKEHYNERLDEQKARSRDAIRREREKFRQQNQAAKKKAKERTLRKQMFESIKDDYDWLTKAVLDPTKTKYIPEAFRASLANLLMQMDLETARSKQLEEKYGRVTSKTLKLRELRDRLNDMATAKAGDDTNLFVIDQYLPYLMNSLAEKYDGQPVSALDVDSLKTLKFLFQALRKNFQNLNRESEESKAAIAAEKASRIVEESLQKISRDGEAKTYEGLKGGMSTINMTALTPPYFFERMGTVNDIYKDLRGGFDTYIRNEADIMNKIKDIVGGYYKKRNIRKNRPTPGSELASWRDSRSAKEIKLSHGTVTMTVAQRMSLLCLANREQARKHMIKGGIVTTPYETASKIEAFKEGRKGKNQWGDKVIFSADDFKADIDTIKASLTPEQIKVAQKLQQLMAVDMAKLGNKAHREMYGYEIFGEPDYFPIKSKDTWIPKDVNNMTDAIEKIKSFGPAKPLEANASNAIVVDDIFSVVADHCNGMNLYNAYLVPISKFMRVYNSTPTLENGTRKPVRDALEEAYGKKAMQYIDNFIRDLNGIKNNNRGGLEDLMNKAIGATKATAVAGNLRVAAQQPTAIVRAAAEMQWKYLAPFLKVKPQKGAMQEMFKYCPIAQWKSWGFYDTYMGRDIEDVMMNNWSKMDVALSGIYGTLDNLTWTAIWQGVKAEQHDLHPEMDIKSDEFLKMCGERASEIFDKTQVVDSTFHRSDAMRSKQVAVKLFTAFMSEPTLTLNVFRSALYDFGELKKAGKTAEANKRLAKALTVLVAQAALVSVAQAAADAWRGKDPGLPWGGDDDDDKDEEATYWERFLHNLAYDFIDQLHIENNLYLIKDVKPYADFMMSKATEYAGLNPTIRALLGWDQEYLYNQNNLVFASLENTANGVSQLFKKLEKGDDYDKEWYDIIQKLASGISPLLGIPAGTLMRDFKPIWNKVFSSVFAADEEASSVTKSEKGESDSSSKQSSVNLWTYDNAPVKIEDGSLTDKVLNHFGVNLTSEEIDAMEKAEAEKERQAQIDKIKNSLAEYSGAEYDKKLWSKKELEGYGKALESGDFERAAEIEKMFRYCGGSQAFLDDKKLYHYKKNYLKTIVYDPTDAQIEQQKQMKDFLLSHGMTEAELSDKVYRSKTGKELKVAFMLNDEDAMVDELIPLIRAGLSYDDYVKLWNNRRRVDLKEYKEEGGKYADRLKSTGVYNWPINGQITSNFGHRSSPGGIGSTNHQGLDIAGSMGQPVTASDGGVVIMAKWYGGAGKTVQIQHDDGTITQYSHLSWWEPKVGDVVAQGQEIGKVGSTGNSTGPHLHFGVMRDGKYVDPLDYLNKKS